MTDFAFIVWLCAQSVVGQFLTSMPSGMGSMLVAERQVLFADLPPQHIALNASMVRYGEHTIMVFRRDYKPGHIALQTQLAVVSLDANFQPTQPHQVLDSRVSSSAKHAGEDPRVFVYRDALYVLFNQTPDGSSDGLRKMYLGRIDVDFDAVTGYSFSMAGFSRLDVPLAHVATRAEKNWVPIVGDDAIRIIYKSNPLEVYRLADDALDALTTHADIMLKPEGYWPGGGTQLWGYGDIRGGTQAIPTGTGDYMALFHSSLESYLRGRYHRTYVMGAYVFEGKPPYAIKAITKEPVLSPAYFDPQYLNLIAFPAGIFERDGLVHVALGVGDEAVYVADIDKQKLLASMTPVWR